MAEVAALSKMPGDTLPPVSLEANSRPGALIKLERWKEEHLSSGQAEREKQRQQFTDAYRDSLQQKEAQMNEALDQKQQDRSFQQAQIEAVHEREMEHRRLTNAAQVREDSKAAEVSRKRLVVERRETERLTERRREAAAAEERRQEEWTEVEERARDRSQERVLKEAAPLTGGVDRELKESEQHSAQKSYDPIEGMLGGVSMSDLMEALYALPASVEDSNFMGSAKKAVRDMKVSVVRYQELQKAKVEELGNTSAAATDVSLMPLLAAFFDDASKLLHAHQEDAAKAMKGVQQNMPEKLLKSIEPMLKLAGSAGAGARMKAPFVLGASFAETPLKKACGQMSSLMKDVSVYGANLTKAHEAINETAKMVPMLSTLMPEATPAVTELVEDALALAYTETVALADASDAILKGISPLMKNRLSCAPRWSSDASTLFGPFAMVLALLISWLAF